MSKFKLSDDELTKKYKSGSNLLHLAKTPINDIGHFMKNHPQLYALGFNIGGRPDGLWVSKGSSWMEKARELNNPKFPVCCFIYQVHLKPGARILHICNEDDFERFDKEFPSYWINLDYFEVDFVDYLSGKTVTNPRIYTLNFNKLRKKPGETIKETLINNKIIFNNARDAMDNCKFYRSTKIPIERFKYKDWAAVAEKYQGVIFNWSMKYKKAMSYLWYQSLDITSGCIWDVSAISISLLYHKIDANYWKKYNM